MRQVRETVFGAGRQVGLDRNVKARIAVYARAWSAENRRPGQHKGPITRAFMDVLKALLWGFHNTETGACFPSYERIAEKAECSRSTVYEALKVLEWAGVLSWQHRITRIRERCTDLFGHQGWRWRVVRTSNAYVLHEKPSKSEIPTGTRESKIPRAVCGAAHDSKTALNKVGEGLEAALASFGRAIAARG